VSNQNPVEIDAASGQVTEYTPAGKPARYRCKLDTLQAVRKEMSVIYRQSRSGLVDIHDATKLVWCLQAIGKVITESELEARITALEEQQK
jgi:hypothetical protein